MCHSLTLTDCFTYLGARVSYASFECQTLEWRLSKGEAAFQRLGKVLKGQHHLTAPQRLRLWQACVWTTTQYGLTASGLPPTGIQKLETFVVRQLRAVLRLPAHITRTTNAEVCSAAIFPHPHVALQTLLCAEGDRISVAPADPFVCAPTDSWWRQIQSTLDTQVLHGITHLDPRLCDAQITLGQLLKLILLNSTRTSTLRRLGRNGPAFPNLLIPRMDCRNAGTVKNSSRLGSFSSDTSQAGTVGSSHCKHLARMMTMTCPCSEAPA